MSSKNNNIKNPREIHPYTVSILLLGFGLWCFWDGWVASDTEYLLFNRIASVVLIISAFTDFLIWRKRLRKDPNKKSG